MTQHASNAATQRNTLPANARYAQPDEACWLCGRQFGEPDDLPEIVHRCGVCWNTAACHAAQQTAVPLSAESVMTQGMKRTVSTDEMWFQTYRQHNRSKYGRRRRYGRSDRHSRQRSRRARSVS